MKIIIIHNKYKEKGGEDFVAESEYQLLKKHGHDIKLMIYDNSEINSTLRILKLFYQSIYNIKVASALKTQINNFQPDIIHVHNFFYIVSPAIFYIAKKKNIPIVMTIHNYRLICAGTLLLRDNKVCELCVHGKLPIHGIIHKCHRNSYLQSLQLTLLTGVHKYLETWRKKVDKFIVLTDYSKYRLLNSSLNLKEDQLEVKANSTEDYGYTPKSKRKKYFLFIGRLSEEKGIRVLLKSLDNYHYNLKIIGDGPLKEIVNEYVGKYNNLEFLGFKDKNVIINELKNCMALIFPSTWYEGMPLTILESFSTGTPVICSNMNNLNNIVQNGYNGLLFQPGSAESLVEQIRFMELLPNDQLFTNARKSYEDNYTPEQNYTNLISIYQGMTYQNNEIK